MFHIFSLVCFLVYGVKSRSGHDRSQILYNFARFGSKTEFLRKFLDDSAWLLLEKLKNMFSFQPKTLIFDQQIQRYFKKIKINENTGFPRVSCGPESHSEAPTTSSHMSSPSKNGRQVHRDP